jgi:hypothetical protein
MARIRTQERGQHPDGGRLAGAVGAQQRDHGAVFDLQGEVLDGDEVAKALRQALGVDGNFCHGP